MTRLIVFVDALGYESARAAGLLALFEEARPLRPGFGYSVNIHVELFAGLQPDAAGFFNMWGIAPDRSPVRDMRWVVPVARAAGRIPGVDARIRRTFAAHGRQTGRIPWQLLPKLGKITRKYLNGPLTPPSIFALPHVRAAHPNCAPGVDRDRAVVDEAEAALRAGERVVVFFQFLDTIGHASGTRSSAWLERLESYCGLIHQLIATARAVDPEGDMYLVSDHAMTGIDTICPAPAVRLCRTGAGQLLFVDSAIVRVWGGSADDPLVQHLAARTDGQIVSEADRERFGVKDRRWGDWIFVLHPGGIFHPDFFVGVYRGAHMIAKAMHGYHPDHESVWGVFAHSGPTRSAAAAGPEPISTLEAHREFRTGLMRSA